MFTLFILSVVVISLVATNNTVVEDVGEVEVCTEISQGSLQRNAIVTITTMPGSAQGT